MAKIKRIILPYGGNRRLAEELGVHEMTVYCALRFHSDTEIQNKIRETALKDFGGQIVILGKDK